MMQNWHEKAQNRLLEADLSSFYDRLIAEVDDNASDLPPADHEILARYYKNLAHNKALRPFYRYNWVRRVAPMAALLRTLPERDDPWSVVDAGCGVGTESLLWAWLRSDVEVIGIDANEKRLHTAQARLRHYQRDVALPVTFHNKDVFDVLPRLQADVVWVMEALSHIDPAEGFLQQTHSHLPAGAYLVISDSHLLNPYMLWRIGRMRMRGAVVTQKQLASGKVITYANERLFAVGQLTRLLREIGFRHVDTQLSVFFPPRFFCANAWRDSFIAIDKRLSGVPLLRHLGGIYTLIAQK